MSTATTTRLPSASTVTHSVVDGQETVSKPFAPSTSVTFQAEAPSVGFVEVTALPPPSTPTQSVVEAQETPFRGIFESASATFQAEEPPIGFVEVTT